MMPAQAATGKTQTVTVDQSRYILATQPLLSLGQWVPEQVPDGHQPWGQHRGSHRLACGIEQL